MGTQTTTAPVKENKALPKPIPNNSVTDISAKNFSEDYQTLSKELKKLHDSTITISRTVSREARGTTTVFTGGEREQYDSQIKKFEDMKKEKEWPLVKALYHLQDDSMKDKFKFFDHQVTYVGGKAIPSFRVILGSPGDINYRDVKINPATGSYIILHGASDVVPQAKITTKKD